MPPFPHGRNRDRIFAMNSQTDHGSATSSRRILGVDFFVGSAPQAVRRGLAARLVVVPAAPALVDLPLDAAYREALEQADLVLTDSGFMVLLWRLLTGERIERVSGYRYLVLLLAEAELRQPGAVFWVMPSTCARDRNLGWLRAQGFGCDESDCYVAPFYRSPKVADPHLCAVLAARKPRHVVICIGGGTQEKLGLHLAQNCPEPISFHCIGAAMGFLSGDQVRIPEWADTWFLGWAFRCLADPRRLVPRYLKAFRLAGLMRQYRHLAPPAV